MIERKFIKHNLKKYAIQEYITKNLYNVGHSYTKLQKTPLGEKITICASRPGLIVGKSGTNIIKLTKDLKEKFDLENPQIELVEVENIFQDANIVAEMIANSLEKFGSQRFKGIGHKVMTDVIANGGMGIEVLISGKIPSSRAKSWRFYQGYLKKCGDIAITGVNKAYSIAKLKTGIIGVQVRILPSSTKLPDHVEFRDELETVVEDVTGKVPPVPTASTEEAKPKKKPKKKAKESKETKEAEEQ